MNIMEGRVKEALKYWNDPETINQFASANVPDYWKTFFEGLVPHENWKVLDLGCGGGRNSSMLVSMGFKVNACDLHQGMVDATRKRISSFIGEDNANLAVVQANMRELPYDNASFDIVLSNGIYHNTSTIKEFERAIDETARVLKKDGRLCMNVFTGEIIHPNLIAQAEPCLYVTPDDLDMILMPKEDILSLLEANGFIPEGTPVSYPSNVSTGVRSVLRGVFRKKGDL